MTRSSTLAEAVWPASPQRAGTSGAANRVLRSAVLAALFSAIIGLLAHVQFKLAITPVPITGQTLGVLLTGALLGPRLGVATILLYLAEGQLGLPVYATAGGITSLGYLVGFVPAAGVVGMFAQRGWDRKALTTALMMASGSIVIYFFGVLWLQQYVGGLRHALAWGVLPFLPGDLVKASIAAALLPTGWRLIGERPGNFSSDAP